MNTKYVVAALKTVETSTELDKFWSDFGIVSDEIKVDTLIQAMGDAKYFDLPDSFYQRRMVLEQMFLTGNWKFANDMKTVKEILGS